MGDTSSVSPMSKNLEMPTTASNKNLSNRGLVASIPNSFKSMTLLSNGRLRSEYAGQIAFFVMKVAALEMFRRLSMAKCPFAWRGFQALQVLCYPPFKWIQRWVPFKGLIMGMQDLSRPLLFLSIGTAFSDQYDYYKENSDGNNDSQESQPYTDPAAGSSTEDASVPEEASQSQEPEIWLVQLREELQKQGISIPQRIDEDELRRFYTAANHNFSSLLSSVKKTIRWRQTYQILSEEDLERWSRFVFWHGYDVKLRPCLVIRLGLACSSLVAAGRRRFTQAVVSQIEQGVLHLVNVEDPRITVLLDCEGLTPLKFPMQIMKSCSSLLQDHYPNRLACMFVLRLPPVVRMIAQTFFQVLKPATRQKLRIEGQAYEKTLSEFLQTIPSFLGGECTCPCCSTLTPNDHRPWTLSAEGNNRIDSSMDLIIGESSSSYISDLDLDLDINYAKIQRTAIVCIAMLWIFIAFLVGMSDVEVLPLFSR